MKRTYRLLLLLALALPFLSFTNPRKPVHKTTVASVSRTLVYPVAGRSRIEDRWGARRAGGLRKHKGIDIHARKGTPVVAVCDGVITERNHTAIGGRTLWLQSAAHGWTAYYAHLDKQYVREGQRVRKGQVIGTVGQTGNARSTPPHLHYGIERGGDWVNPYPYVQHSKKVSVAKKKTTTRTPAAKKRVVSKKRRR